MKLIAEPLLHFMIGGAILFAGYSWIDRDQVESGRIDPVRVGEGEIRWLRTTWTSQWHRPPSTSELQGLVTDLVNEELLAREAAQMGLDRDDTVIRRRLAQKLKFVVEDTWRLADPTDQELRAYFEANTARFRNPPRVSFRHVYFNPEKRAAAMSDATMALAQLAGNGGSGLVETLGDRILIEADIRNADEQTVSGMFGAEFAKAVFALQPGKWSGPIQSGFGVHLVSLTSISAGSLPPFEEVREEVRREWLREKQMIATREYLDRLREKYGVEFDESVKALLAVDPTEAVATR